MTRSIPWLVVAAFASPLAYAQPAPPAPPAPPAQEPADQAYQRGRNHYDLREWDRAIAEFKEAYRLRPDAPSLFNIAQSYRLKGDCVQALSFYKTYRRNFPSEKNIDRVDQFIVEMEACAKQAPTTTGPGDNTKTGTTTTTGTATTTGTTATDQGQPGNNSSTSTTGGSLTTTTTPVDQPARTIHRRYLIAAIAAGGVGLGSLVGGVVFGMRASSIEADIEELPRWDPALHDSGERADLVSKLLLGVGGAAVVTSGVLVYVGLRKGESAGNATAVRFVPRTDGALVVWSGSL